MGSVEDDLRAAFWGAHTRLRSTLAKVCTLCRGDGNLSEGDCPKCCGSGEEPAWGDRA